MRTYLVQYIDSSDDLPKTEEIEAIDKTNARDLFFEMYPSIEFVERITPIRQEA